MVIFINSSFKLITHLFQSISYSISLIPQIYYSQQFILATYFHFIIHS
nr:MAG TPA: hypothetical protein [Caudoviricetes sp.]